MARNSVLSSFLLGLSFTAIINAQSKAFVDSRTGIQFQQVTQGDFEFGIALPERPSEDFIGRISAKGTKGWAGLSLGGRMANSLMVVDWPNEKKIIASLRYSSGYASPGPSRNASATLKTIPAGTSVESDSYTYMFLCKGCLQSDGSTFRSDAETFNLGYGLSTSAISAPSNPLSPVSFHAAGQGMFPVDLKAARSSQFALWAETAKDAQDAGVAVAGGGGAQAAAREIPVTTSKFTYDYIVVGSGPAGLIAAQRLTETGKSVLLLERGIESIARTGGKRFTPFNSTVTFYDVPALFMSMFGATESEGFCTDTAGLGGCILGGGGSMNGMAFIRPPSWDFDHKWPEGWKSKDMAPSATRLYARNPGTTTPSTDGKHYDNELYTMMEEWFKSNGWNHADTIEKPDDKERSYSHPALNTINGIRGGPLWTYLPLAQARSNFILQLRSKVIRVVRNGAAITGVEIEKDSEHREIINLRPGGAVILAAGVVSTPRILFNSGIGRKEQIEIVKNGQTKIQLPDPRDWIDLPVGYHVKDHSRYQLFFNVTYVKQYTNQQLMNPPAADVEAYSKGAGVLAQSFMRMDTFRRITTSDGHKIMFQAHIAEPEPGKVEFTYLLTHGATSVGQLSINAAGNTVFAKEPWTHTDTDREAWRLAITELLDMARKPGSKVTFAGGPEANASSITSGPAQQGVHFVGGAKMGSDDGRKPGGTAVVDLDTKVYGTENLFVVDASFHPDLSTGNTQAIIMVGSEHATQKIIAKTAKKS